MVLEGWTRWASRGKSEIGGASSTWGFRASLALCVRREERMSVCRLEENGETQDEPIESVSPNREPPSSCFSSGTNPTSGRSSSPLAAPSSETKPTYSSGGGRSSNLGNGNGLPPLGEDKNPSLFGGKVDMACWAMGEGGWGPEEGRLGSGWWTGSDLWRVSSWKSFSLRTVSFLSILKTVDRVSVIYVLYKTGGEQTNPCFSRSACIRPAPMLAPARPPSSPAAVHPTTLLTSPPPVRRTSGTAAMLPMKVP